MSLRDDRHPAIGGPSESVAVTAGVDGRLGADEDRGPATGRDPLGGDGGGSGYSAGSGRRSLADSSSSGSGSDSGYVPSFLHTATRTAADELGHRHRRGRPPLDDDAFRRVEQWPPGEEDAFSTLIAWLFSKIPEE